MKRFWSVREFVSWNVYVCAGSTLPATSTGSLKVATTTLLIVRLLYELTAQEGADERRARAS